MNNPRLRIGIDSNILCAGTLVPWGAPKAVLILAAARIFELILLQLVINEVERVLLARGAALVLRFLNATRVRSGDLSRSRTTEVVTTDPIRTYEMKR